MCCSGSNREQSPPGSQRDAGIVMLERTQIGDKQAGLQARLCGRNREAETSGTLLAFVLSYGQKKKSFLRKNKLPLASDQRPDTSSDTLISQAKPYFSRRTA